MIIILKPKKRTKKRSKIRVLILPLELRGFLRLLQMSEFRMLLLRREKSKLRNTLINIWSFLSKKSVTKNSPLIFSLSWKKYSLINGSYWYILLGFSLRQMPKLSFLRPSLNYLKREWITRTFSKVLTLKKLSKWTLITIGFRSLVIFLFGPIFTLAIEISNSSKKSPMW